MATQKKAKKEYQYRPTTENTPARNLRWLGMFIGNMSMAEIDEVWHIGTSDDGNKNYAQKYCNCDEPKPVGVKVARYCWRCKRDLKFEMN